jgi:hypothetical protein
MGTYLLIIIVRIVGKKLFLITQEKQVKLSKDACLYDKIIKKSLEVIIVK